MYSLAIYDVYDVHVTYNEAFVMCSWETSIAWGSNYSVFCNKLFSILLK